MSHDEEVRRFRRTLEGLIGTPATEGNAVDVLRNGDEIFPSMLDAIRAAERTVDFMTFVYWTGDIARAFADALTERARAGVRVRILLDAVGARLMDEDLVAELEESGAIVDWFRPPTTWKVWEANHRTHRKILVCDEEVGFTGGVGIAQEWCGDARDETEWRDTHLRVRGPAVDGLRAAFTSDWAEAGNPLCDERDLFPDQPDVGDVVVQVVTGSAGAGWSDIGTLFDAIIRTARRTIRLTTAYFVPDERYAAALREAVERGVDVHVLVPGPHADKRVVQIVGEEEYEPMLDAGVRISCFQPTMLHAKVLTADGIVSTVGSANFNHRSLGLDDEANIVMLDPEITGLLDGQFDEDLERSVGLDPDRWRDRSVVQKVSEKAASALENHM
ncbi:MAG TPA: phospholipase D-like domain-containing protein [Acidimicrobiales bacterium]